jgi:UDP-N-acetylglucosamine:LPS N-acetylglucosamine transferase
MEVRMAKKQILFLSWQGGLGHITRDLPIIKELRKLNTEVEVSWLAHPLASKLIQQAGEKLLPESQLSADYNEVGLSGAISNFSLNLMKYVALGEKTWAHNADLLKRVITKYPFDLIIGDETYEVQTAVAGSEIQLKCKMIMIEDFVGMDAMSINPLEIYGIYRNNRFLANYLPLLSSQIERFFVGELEDIPDKRYGFRLPNRREMAQKYYHILGHILRFNPADYADKSKIRAKLGYGNESLMICATGGTSAGKKMLETCGKAYTILKKDIPDLRMVCVCGELFGQKPPELPPDVELHGYIPDLYEHYAACDMAVVVGGGTTATELTALRRPFVFFPLERQFDQQLNVAERLARQGAGIKMRYHRTTPESLANMILAHIGQEVDWKTIPTDGAQKAAKLINNFLVRGQVVA